MEDGMNNRRKFDWHNKPVHEKYSIIPSTNVNKVMEMVALQESGASTEQYLSIMGVSLPYLKKMFEKAPDLKRPYDWEDQFE